jgi:HD-like signal output (HDOD) protein
MSLKVLAHVARHRSARMTSDTETVTAALLMMGTSNFFRTFAGQSTVEARLGPIPGAIAGLEQVLRRAHRAGRFAISFAMARNDTDAEVIQEAALLHDFAEMLLWCHAPVLAREIRERQLADPTLRSAQAQQDVLNIRLEDLQRALMQAWRLPELLAQITDHTQMALTRVRNVVLAVDLARHSQRGWDNPAIPDDLAAIGRLLNLKPESVLEKVQALDD